MQDDRVGGFPGQSQHHRADGRQRDRDARQAGRARREVGRHQVELVGVALERERNLFLPCPPDRMQGADIVAHARHRRRPRDAEAALVVRLHLRPDAEHETSVGRLVQVPGIVRRDRRRARKRDGDGRSELDAVRRERRGGQRQEGIVGILCRDHGIEPSLLRQLRDLLRLPQIVVRYLRDYPHRESPVRSRPLTMCLARPADPVAVPIAARGGCMVADTLLTHTKRAAPLSASKMKRFI